MPSISLPQVKWAGGKRKERSQMTEMHTSDGRNMSLELESIPGACLELRKQKLFLTDIANQYINEEGYYVQVLWEEQTMPLCMVEHTKILGVDNRPGPEDDSKLLLKKLNQMFHETSEQEKLRLWLDAKKNSIMTMLMWLVAMPCAATLLIFAMVWFFKRG